MIVGGVSVMFCCFFLFRLRSFLGGVRLYFLEVACCGRLLVLVSFQVCDVRANQKGRRFKHKIDLIGKIAGSAPK